MSGDFMDAKRKRACPAERPKPSIFLAGAMAVLVPALAAHAAGPTSKPVAGAVITVKFPEMPRTFAGAVPQMAISLPVNYDPARKHPLLIFLRGGDGGDDNNPATVLVHRVPCRTDPKQNDGVWRRQVTQCWSVVFVREQLACS